MFTNQRGFWDKEGKFGTEMVLFGCKFEYLSIAWFQILEIQ
jgi:hypothetical protein